MQKISIIEKSGLPDQRNLQRNMVSQKSKPIIASILKNYSGSPLISKCQTLPIKNTMRKGHLQEVDQAV